MPDASERSIFGEKEKARLAHIIEQLSVIRGKEMRLASGGTTDIYFNLKRTMLDPEGASLIADAILDALGDAPIDAVGGLAMGAVPLVAAVCVKSHARARPIRGFYVRKEAKTHGTEDSIDGHLREGDRVVLFEDVTTTGTSALRAANAVRQRGARAQRVITVVDRLEGAEAALAAAGLSLVAVLTKNDFRR